ncbi:hypothetical protein [Streptomyces sp. DH12]|uniref:hypothetical protein n=1 Tax=Streptomyces sp. DH12 TaxID=2857010 RepID=UPI001E431887|nr:hypothetical protein [Streptomyces sp. DH12]
MTTTHTVVGVDPSLTATGIASTRGWCQTVGYTRARAKDPGITQLPHPERRAALNNLRQTILDTIGHPDLVVMELPAVSRSGGGAHERGWLWWTLYDRLTRLDIPIGLLTPNQRAQYATGKGTAGKGMVVDAVARRWPQWPTEGDDNAADAVTLMAAGCDWLGTPLTTVPQTHRNALTKAIWPAPPAQAAA